MSQAQTGDGPKPAKKSFFKKSSWQKAEQRTESRQSDDATDFFKRNQFKDIIAEQENRLKESRQRKNKKEGKKPVSGERDTSDAKKGTKKRVSGDLEDSESDEDLRSPPKKGKAKKESFDSSRESTPPLPQRVPNPEEISHRSKTSELTKQTPVVVDILDSDSEVEFSHPTSALQKNRDKGKVREDELDDDDDLDDPHLRKLAAEARERQRQREFETMKSASPPNGEPSMRASHHNSATQPEEPPAKVIVLVHSSIENTSPLLVTIFINTPLGRIKEAWCTTQKTPLREEIASSFFLTHKGQRLYDVTTVKALGVTVDNVDELGQIEIEAVTQEIVEERQRQMAKSRIAEIRKNAVRDSSSAEPSPEKPKGIKLILKAKGLDEFKLEVKPSSTFQRIINVFRSTYKISKEQNIVLRFDGDPLDPEQTMQDTEIEEMDVIEVHLSS